MILAGGRSGVTPAAVAALHERTGWPILADPISAMRGLDGAVATADALLRSESFVDAHRPDVIVRIGRPASSKVLAQWSVSAGAPLVQVGGPGVIDPDRNVRATCSMEDVLAAASGAATTDWLAGWLAADEIAQRTIDECLASHRIELTEPGVARAVAMHLPADAELTVASSMPIRDLEWFGGPLARAHANRGANGIDGVVSTALGRALDGRTSIVLIGDLAFVHDSNALVGLAARGADLRIVVVDNDGGGIFSFLPQATVLPSDRFEQLFGTPLGADVLAIAAAHGIPTSTVTTTEALVDQLGRPGPWVCRIPSDRSRNVHVHSELHAAISAALDAADGSRSRTDDGAEHGLELGLRFGEFGRRIAVGDDAASGHEASRGPIGRQLGAADRHRPRAVAERVDPTDRPAVPAALEPLDPLDQFDGVGSGVPAERRRRAQGAHQLDDRRAGLGQHPFQPRAEVLDVGHGHDRRLRLPVEIARPRQQGVVDDVDHDPVLELVLRAGDQLVGDPGVVVGIAGARRRAGQRDATARRRHRPRRAVRVRRR